MLPEYDVTSTPWKGAVLRRTGMTIRVLSVGGVSARSNSGRSCWRKCMGELARIILGRSAGSRPSSGGGASSARHSRACAWNRSNFRGSRPTPASKCSWRDGCGRPTGAQKHTERKDNEHQSKSNTGLHILSPLNFPISIRNKSIGYKVYLLILFPNNLLASFVNVDLNRIIRLFRQA